VRQKANGLFSDQTTFRKIFCCKKCGARLRSRDAPLESFSVLICGLVAGVNGFFRQRCAAVGSLARASHWATARAAFS
jgi:hypothetical protein